LGLIQSGRGGGTIGGDNGSAYALLRGLIDRAPIHGIGISPCGRSDDIPGAGRRLEAD